MPVQYNRTHGNMSSHTPQNIPIFVDTPVQLNISRSQLKKMTFIMNALDQGWAVKKRDGSYIFTKKHENRREVFMENYLETFIHSNFDTSILHKTDL